MARLQRFKWWVIELIANIVVLASFLSYQYYLPEEKNWSDADSWIFFVSTIACFLSFLGIVASVFQRDEERLCRIESILIWTVTAVWTIGTVKLTLGPLQNNAFFAVESYIRIHPNLYFFSFFALIVAVVLMASWFNQHIYGEVENSTSTQWILLGAISFLSMLSGIGFRENVVLVESIETFPNGTMTNVTIATPICETDLYNCNRVTFTIVLSAISATIACIVTPWKGSSRICQSDVGIALLIGWLFGVYYITFDKGPGAQWGTLYFATFLNVFLCLRIVVQSTAGSDVPQVVHPPRASSTIERGAIFDAAYNRLRRMSVEAIGKIDRSESYASLFEDVAISLNDGEADNAPLTSLNRQFFEDLKCHSYAVKQLELWCVLMIETTVNIGALVPKLSDQSSRLYSEKLVLLLPCLSIVVSFFGFATCMRKSLKSKIIQRISVTLTLMIWIISIPFLNNIADSDIFGYDYLDAETTARNANFFFSTWISLIVVLLLVTNLFHASIVTSDWCLLAVFSFAFMASSIVFYNDSVDESEGPRQGTFGCSDELSIRYSKCKRATLGLYLGLLSGVISMVMVALHRSGPILHFLASLPLLLSWGFAVALITFSIRYNVAAGALYFSCWAAAFLTVDLTTMNVLLLVKEKEKQSPAAQEEPSQTSRPFIVTPAAGVIEPRPADTMPSVEEFLTNTDQTIEGGFVINENETVLDVIVEHTERD